jgi:DNA processing protein
VLVVEAAKKSGSLITAHYALEQGREVFAIPGSIHNPLARGAHSLIKQGAKLVETTDDILEELGSVVTAAIVSTPLSTTSNNDELLLEPEYEVLLEKIGFDAISVDELVKSSGLTAESVSSMLLILELQGLVESRHGGKYCRCPQK